MPTAANNMTMTNPTRITMGWFTTAETAFLAGLNLNNAKLVIADTFSFSGVGIITGGGVGLKDTRTGEEKDLIAGFVYTQLDTHDNQAVYDNLRDSMVKFLETDKHTDVTLNAAFPAVIHLEDGRKIHFNRGKDKPLIIQEGN